MSQIQQVKEAADIVALIGERFNLQRAGTYFRGLCPFHSEKSPSFFVSPALQRYKCFGCGESGDSFTFLEKYEGMSFYEALTYLAEQHGITLEQVHRTADDSLRDELLSILSLTKEYYHFLLTKHKVGEPARQFLRSRGISQESVRIFQLGYSLPDWDGLLKFLHGKKKIDVSLLEKAGVVLKGKHGRYYDRFRGRIMFPLRNHRGQIVGFSGRVLEKSAKDAKYINSPETMLYHKSRMLYGLSELYQQIRVAGQVVIVEGEFDVITSVQAHVDTAVAIKGSALTAEHAQLLNRVAQTVVLALDADAAGVEATKKAIAALRTMTLDLKVVELPKGKDPDELAQSDPKLWRQSVEAAIPAYEFVIRATLKQHDSRTGEGKRHIMNELAPLLASITHVVEQEHYIRSVAERLGVKFESVRADIERFGQQKQLTGRAVAEETERKPRQLTRREVLERLVLFLLFQLQGADFVSWRAKLSHYSFTQPALAALMRQLLRFTNTFELTAFNKTLPEDAQQVLFDVTTDYQHLVLKDQSDKFNPVTELSERFVELQQETKKEQVAVITAELETLDGKQEKTPAEEERQNELLREIVSLQQSE